MKKKLKNKNYLKNLIKLLKKPINFIFDIGAQNKRMFETFQLTLIYFLGLFQLLMTCLQMSDPVPEFYKIIPFFHQLVYSPLGRFFSNPDKVYIFYLLAQELVLIRPYIFRFSLIVRYNILYIMTLELIFYCIVNWWDALCNIEEDLIFQPKIDQLASTNFHLLLYVIFLIIYIYSYIQALRRKIPNFPDPILQKIPDSVAFFLQIKRDNNKKK